MLKFESVFWASHNTQELADKLESLGFSVTSSRREGSIKSVYFGPESFELFSPQDQLSTLSDQGGLKEFVAQGDGIFGVGLESTDIVADYRRLISTGKNIERPRIAKDKKAQRPLWTGFSLPQNQSPLLRTWVMMNSPEVLEEQSSETLPLKHKNTCFGIEGIHLISYDPEKIIQPWADLVQRAPSGLHWQDLYPTRGRRLQTGERFFDVIKAPNETTAPSASLSAGRRASERDGVFMLTLKVTDLELAKSFCEKAKVPVIKCSNRDGFIVPSSIACGVNLRFVRAFWKRYLPDVSENYPLGRRPDTFRPLGGANSTTLAEGFDDNWKY